MSDKRKRPEFIPTPTLSAELVTIDGADRYRVYCYWCECWHDHEPQEGYYEPICSDLNSLYLVTGYFIKLNLTGKT